MDYSEDKENIQAMDDYQNELNRIIEAMYLCTEDALRDFLKYHCGFEDYLDVDQPKDYTILYNLIKRQLPVTIILENKYVDRIYRDSYYMYFSSKHKNISRFCKRISLFKGDIRQDNSNYIVPVKMKELFIGSVVIRPLDNQRIGRSLLNPYFFLEDRDNSYLKCCKYTIVVNGCSLSVNAFPYSMQDGETTTCAEITILNLTDYFSKRYQNYRIAMPSDISKIVDRDGFERPLPSRGLRYFEISKVLSELGFSPRLFSPEMVQDSMQLKRIMHYYLESGIPVALGVKSNESQLHSIICVGHGKINKQKKSKRVFINKGHAIWIIDTSDLCENYIVMDDCEEPYKTIKWEEKEMDYETITGKFSFGDAELITIVVPLYKRMFLEAEDAFKVCMDYLGDLEGTLGIRMLDVSQHLGEKDNPMVVRFFMASSRHFKEQRLSCFERNNDDSLIYYTSVLFPKFVWVCEIYTKDGYEKDNPEAIGEIVIDATASKYENDKALLVHFGKYITTITTYDFDDKRVVDSDTGLDNPDIDKIREERLNNNVRERNRHTYVLENWGKINSYDCNLNKPTEKSI